MVTQKAVFGRQEWPRGWWESLAWAPVNRASSQCGQEGEDETAHRPEWIKVAVEGG